MDNTKARILQFVEYKHLSKREFCKKSNLSHTIFNNESALGSDKLEKIYTAFPELSIEWVVTGRGHMIIGSPNNEGQDEELKEKYFQLIEKYSKLQEQYTDLLRGDRQQPVRKHKAGNG